MPLTAYTAFDRLDRSSANEDPLGFFTYATRLADVWLPGITTRTRRIRYYTIICGGLHLIEDEFKDEIRKVENHDEEIVRLFMRWERLWAVWNGADERSRGGMIGRNKVEALFKKDVFTSQSVDYPFIQRQSDLGALGAYRSSMVAMRLLCEDRIELTYDGRKLGRMFWDQGGNRRAWNQSVRVLASGKIVFPRSRDRLAEYAARFGLDRNLLKDERAFLRGRLLPPDDAESRRSRLFDYIRKHKWGGLNEYGILARSAHRGISKGGHTEGLERCAAAIVALEHFRATTLVLLNMFRDQLREARCPQSPGVMARGCGKSVCDDVNRTHKGLLRFVQSGEFVTVFQAFPMADCRPGQDAVAWLRDLLRIHKEEMAKRRTPRWFIPAGGDKWTLDESVAGVSTNDERPAPYSYRTVNLLRMARETGCRV